MSTRPLNLSMPGTTSAAGPSVPAMAAYAAPAAGSMFFYIPMWSILPGIYATHFGVALSTIAAIVLCLRLFDGAAIFAIGYLSDYHRAAGGSRKPWVAIGAVGVVISCYFLFNPPLPATGTYYLLWSLAYFLAFLTLDVPHATWGSELTLDYQQRAKIFGMRNVMNRTGIVAFYMLPLLPLYASTDYTPQVLRDAVYVGGTMLLIGTTWSMLSAPPAVAEHVAGTRSKDTARLLLQSLFLNKPLLVYVAAFGALGLCYGMWFGLLFLYLDSFLKVGDKIAVMFLAGTIASTPSIPLWLKIVERWSKATAWSVGVVLFIAQSIAMWFVAPGDSWWIVFVLIVIANLCFTCHDMAALSILGDIADYGKWKFNKDRTATYFAFNGLLFQIGLGLGGGISLGVAGLMGFVPSAASHSAVAILGLKLGFIVLPVCLALIGLFFIGRMPIDRRRHRVIQRRIESRLGRVAAPVRSRGATQDEGGLNAVY